MLEVLEGLQNLAAPQEGLSFVSKLFTTMSYFSRRLTMSL
jgi:hypothetical protein